MNADSAFHIGQTHDVCQDYAAAGFLTGNGDAPAPYAIISDGCSSSPDTDTGARLLVKSAERLLSASGQVTPDSVAQLHAAAASAAIARAAELGMSPDALDATLLSVHFNREEQTCVVGCSGDGLVLFERPTGEAEIYSVSYPSGYPFYPAYLHQPERLAGDGEAAHASRFTKHASRFTKEVKRFRRDRRGEEFQLLETYQSDAPTEVFCLARAVCRLVALASDGLHSFHSPRLSETTRSVEAISPARVFAELVACRSLRGSFVRRRVRGFLKLCDERGWRHADDFAVAMLHLGD